MSQVPAGLDPVFETREHALRTASVTRRWASSVRRLDQREAGGCGACSAAVQGLMDAVRVALRVARSMPGPRLPG